MHLIDITDIRIEALKRVHKVELLFIKYAKLYNAVLSEDNNWNALCSEEPYYETYKEFKVKQNRWMLRISTSSYHPEQKVIFLNQGGLLYSYTYDSFLIHYEKEKLNLLIPTAPETRHLKEVYINKI